MVNHSDESYKCEKMSACPYTGTTIINKIPWGDCPADSDSDSSSQHSSATESEAGETQEEDQAEESDTNREEESGTAAGSTARAQQDSKSNTARKPGLLNKIKRLFRK